MDKNELDYTKIGRERIITIAELIKEIFRRFLLVIIVAIVFAVLLGTYKYVKDVNDANAAKNTIEETVENSDLSDEEVREVNNVLSIQKNMEEQQQYIENSILMRINAYDESIVTLQYRINNVAEEELGKNTEDLLKIYDDYIDHGGLVADLCDNGIDVEPQYLNELISSSADEKSSNYLSAQGIEIQNSVFYVKIIHEDKNSCDDLAEAVAECMNKYYISLNSSVAAHVLTLVDRSYSEVVDTSIWTYKVDRVNSINNMKDKIETLTADMSASQLSMIEQYKAQDKAVSDELDENEKSDDNISISLSKKYIVLGGFVGIVLACLYIILCYILRGTINKASDIQYLYNQRIISELNLKKKNRFWCALWNRLIGRKQVILTQDEEYKLLLSNLKKTCMINHVKTLMISSSENLSDDNQWMAQLSEDLAKNDIVVNVRLNMLYSSEAIEHIEECDGIVLVEQVRRSRYVYVEKTIKCCLEYKKDVLGVIVLQ